MERRYNTGCEEFRVQLQENRKAPYAEAILGMIDGYGNIAGSAYIDKLNVKASEDGKTLTIVLSEPCAYFDKIVFLNAMYPRSEDCR